MDWRLSDKKNKQKWKKIRGWLHSLAWATFFRVCRGWRRNEKINEH
jgi:hypothetical protein